LDRALHKAKSGILRALSAVVPERAILAVQTRAFADRFLDGLFKRHRPALTVLSWGGVCDPCPMVVRSARKHGCRTISLDASWDCMDELAVVPKLDRLLVWNEAMKAEAVARHRYDPGRVSAAGLLRCDDYPRRGGWVDRGRFLAERGFDPDRRLVTLAVNRGDPAVYLRVVTALLDAVNRYLVDPRQDREGRKAVLQRLCLGCEGMAKTRALQEIGDQLGS